MPCPQCASPTPPGARFCPQCGVALAQAHAAAAAGTGERRVVAILFADLSGSTRLASELGAEEMHRLLTRYFELVDRVIAQRGGTVDKHMGDGVMALFGAPIAHGNDTLRALRAAVSIHGAMHTLATEMGRPLTAHVGIASGEVVAADTGSDVHRTYTVTGDAVNLAARLLDVARAGETAISDDVYRECMPSVEADHVATMAIRGFAREMAVWKLRSLRDETAAAHPLLGREAQVARFDALMLAVESTRRGGRRSIARSRKAASPLPTSRSPPTSSAFRSAIRRCTRRWTTPPAPWAGFARSRRPCRAPRPAVRRSSSGRTCIGQRPWCSPGCAP